MAINGIVGAGIFGLPAKISSLTGAWSLLAFLICGALAAMIALCFAEVGSRFQESGGPYLYAQRALGDTAGFTVGALWWLSRVAAFAANVNLMVDYAGMLWPKLSNHQFRIAAIIAFTLALLLTNLRGVRDSTKVSNLLTLAKLVVLLSFVMMGLPHIQTRLLHFDPAISSDNLSLAVTFLLYAFTGFEMAAVPAGEIQKPQSDMPFALMTSIGIVVALYIGLQLVCMGTLPGLAESSRPLADAAAHFAGSWAGIAVVCGAVLSIAGNLNLLLLSSSRITFAMANKGALPSQIANISRTRHTPYVALIFTAAAMLFLSLSHSFLAAVTVSSACRLIAYAATAISLLRLRSMPELPPAQFKLKLAIPVVGATVATTLWLLMHIRSGEQHETAALAGVIVTWAILWRKLKQPI